MEDLQEHLAELFGGSAYEDTIAALEERKRRHKAPGKHAPEIPARAIPVAPLGARAFALIQYFTSFEYIDPAEDARRQLAVDLLSGTPNISFAPWNGGKVEIIANCTKLNVPADEAPRIVAYVLAIEHASSDLISTKLLDHALTLLGRESDAARELAGARDLAKGLPAPSVGEQARAIVERFPLPRLFETLPAQDVVDITTEFIARYGRSTAGGRHHVFKRETLVDWLAHDASTLAVWLRRIGRAALADNVDRVLRQDSAS